MLVLHDCHVALPVASAALLALAVACGGSGSSGGDDAKTPDAQAPAGMDAGGGGSRGRR